MEIERKFLIKNYSGNLSELEHHELKQGYISTKPVIRIRKWDNTKILTIKSSGLIMRDEYEIELSEDEFQNLEKKVEGNIINKTRYIIPINNNLKIEMDIFHDIFEGLCYGEVEFPDIETAENFKAPDFMYKDISKSGVFQNSSLSRMELSDVSAFIKNAYK